MRGFSERERRSEEASVALRIGSAVALLAAGCSGSPGSSVTHQRYAYTCCSAPDVTRAWHPGQTLTLHWTAQPAGTTSAAAARVTLTAVITGPYRDVASLKSREPAASTLRSAPIVVGDQSGQQPESTIVLPAELQPGYYDLATRSEAASGNSAGGDSVIQVTPTG